MQIRKFTILIIDDEKNIREGLAANFELEDYNVDSFFDQYSYDEEDLAS